MKPLSPRVLWSLLSLAFALTGCKAKVGDACVGKQHAVCGSPSQQLVCQEGAYVASDCKAGCSQLSAELLSCDRTGNKAGDRCAKEEKGAVVCLGKGGKDSLVCDGATFVARACLGERGCQVSGQGVARCDLGEPEADSKCTHEGAGTCSADHKAMFHCRSNVWKRDLACSGKNGCSPREFGETCDVGSAEPASPCVKELKDKPACSLDKKHVLACDGQAWQPGAACAADEECKVSEFNVDCGENCLMTAKTAACAKNVR